jgi:hypothetical protein
VNFDSEMGHKSGSDIYVINQKPKKKKKKQERNMEEFHKLVVAYLSTSSDNKALSCHF